MEELLKEILDRLDVLEEGAEEFQETLLDRLDRLDEAISNISTPGRNYEIEYED